jgi:hypothetical protein
MSGEDQVELLCPDLAHPLPSRSGFLRFYVYGPVGAKREKDERGETECAE